MTQFLPQHRIIRPDAHRAQHAYALRRRCRIVRRRQPHAVHLDAHFRKHREPCDTGHCKSPGETLHLPVAIQSGLPVETSPETHCRKRCKQRPRRQKSDKAKTEVPERQAEENRAERRERQKRERIHDRDAEGETAHRAQELAPDAPSLQATQPDDEVHHRHGTHRCALEHIAGQVAAERLGANAGAHFHGHGCRRQHHAEYERRHGMRQSHANTGKEPDLFLCVFHGAYYTKNSVRLDVGALAASHVPHRNRTGPTASALRRSARGGRVQSP